MIKKLHVKNFRCLKDVEITFEPLTVLVGPNGSGKSTVLLALAAESLTNADCWLRRSDVQVEITAEYDDANRETYHRSARLQPGHYAPIGAKANCQTIHFDLAQLRSSNHVQEAKRLDSMGGNLANVFATFSRQVKGKLAGDFASLVPIFGDIDARPASSGHHRIVFQDRWDSNVWYEPSEVSDGTMLVLAYLVLKYQDPPVELLAIEEPERGLHPYLLGQLAQLMRKLSSGELGSKPIQIVLATHSAELLDFVEPNEVRFLTRNAQDGSVTVENAPADSADWKRAYREYGESLGALWLSGNLGAVPGP